MLYRILSKVLENILQSQGNVKFRTIKNVSEKINNAIFSIQNA